MQKKRGYEVIYGVWLIRMNNNMTEGARISGRKDRLIKKKKLKIFWYYFVGFVPNLTWGKSIRSVLSFLLCVCVCVFLINHHLYIDGGGFVWEVRSQFDISSSTNKSPCENTEPRGLIFDSTSLQLHCKFLFMFLADGMSKSWAVDI